MQILQFEFNLKLKKKEKSIASKNGNKIITIIQPALESSWRCVTYSKCFLSPDLMCGDACKICVTSDCDNIVKHWRFTLDSFLKASLNLQAKHVKHQNSWQPEVNMETATSSYTADET